MFKPDDRRYVDGIVKTIDLFFSILPYLMMIMTIGFFLMFTYGPCDWMTDLGLPIPYRCFKELCK